MLAAWITSIILLTSAPSYVLDDPEANWDAGSDAELTELSYAVPNSGFVTIRLRCAKARRIEVLLQVFDDVPLGRPLPITLGIGGAETRYSARTANEDFEGSVYAEFTASIGDAFIQGLATRKPPFSVKFKGGRYDISLKTMGDHGRRFVKDCANRN